MHDIEATQMTLSWESPSNDGGTQIIGYIVEYREMPSTIWKSITIEGLSHKIKHLKESHTYTFRVAAENKVEVGPFSESSQGKTYGKKTLKNNFMINIPYDCVSKSYTHPLHDVS